MAKLSLVSQGLLVVSIFVLVSLTALSWTNGTITPAWSGEDQETALMYCFIERPKTHQSDEYLRLSRLPSLWGTLSTITLSKSPEPNIEVMVYSDRSFASTVQHQEQKWVSGAEYEDLLQKVMATQVFTLIPDTELGVVDGIWFGIEYKWDGGISSFGTNNMKQVGELVEILSQACGPGCSSAAALADSIELKDEYNIMNSPCPPLAPFNHDEETRINL